MPWGCFSKLKRESICIFQKGGIGTETHTNPEFSQKKKILRNTKQSSSSDTYFEYTPVHHYLKIACTSQHHNEEKSLLSAFLINPQEIKLIGKKNNLHFDLSILQEYHFGLLACKYDTRVQKKLSIFTSRKPVNGSLIFKSTLMGALFVLTADQYLQS